MTEDPEVIKMKITECEDENLWFDRKTVNCQPFKKCSSKDKNDLKAEKKNTTYWKLNSETNMCEETKYKMKF